MHGLTLGGDWKRNDVRDERAEFRLGTSRWTSHLAQTHEWIVVVRDTKSTRTIRWTHQSAKSVLVHRRSGSHNLGCSRREGKRRIDHDMYGRLDGVSHRRHHCRRASRVGLKRSQEHSLSTQRFPTAHHIGSDRICNASFVPAIWAPFPRTTLAPYDHAGCGWKLPEGLFEFLREFSGHPLPMPSALDPRTCSRGARSKDRCMSRHARTWSSIADCVDSTGGWMRS